MGLKQIDHGTREYQQMVDLRYEILRKPLGLEFRQEYLDQDMNDILIAAFEEEKMLGCCILTPLEQGAVRLRQMAVHKKLQGKGIGESIMMFAENIARDKGYKKMMMHARDNVIGFYEKFGYKIKGDQFIEVKTPHHVMEKPLR
ncbi:MAG: GNAT family N-acetyltransferase [Bacteroidota bacterium]